MQIFRILYLYQKNYFYYFEKYFHSFVHFQNAKIFNNNNNSSKLLNLLETTIYRVKLLAFKKEKFSIDNVKIYFFN